MDNKENHEDAEDAPTLPSVASPRISSVGGASEDRPQFHDPQAYEMTSGHDHLHWGGVGRRVGAHTAWDTRSIASSAATRDDKSIYEEPGALDATEEVEEHMDDDEHDGSAGEPEMVAALSQPRSHLSSVQLHGEASNVDSAFTGLSAGGSLAEVVDQLADQAVDGQLSPRQAAAAIRTATHDAADASGGGGSTSNTSHTSSAAAVAATVGGSAGLPDGLAPDGASDSVSVSGVAHSSIAPSEDNWQAAGGGGGAGSAADASERAPSEAAAVDAPAETAQAETAQPLPPPVPTPVAGKEEEQEAAALPPPSDLTEAQLAANGRKEKEEAATFELHTLASAELPASTAAAAVVAEKEAEAGADARSDAGTAAGSDGSISVPLSGTSLLSANGTADGSAAGTAVPGRNGPPTYHSRFMQQLAASASEEDITIYSSEDAATTRALTDTLQQPPAHQPLPQQAQQAQQAAASAAAAPVKPAGMQPLSIADGGGGGGSGRAATADTSAALAAINASGGNSAAAGNANGAGANEGAQAPPTGLLFPQSWYQTFRGLLYMDGVDALGRPVVVLNADAVPPTMKSSALVYVKAHLEPLVNQGDYVLVFTSRGATKLPSMWIMGAYRTLPRPFRKHVQYIVLVRPSAFLRTVLAFMRPFVSKKAGRKIKQVQSVHEIAEATGGEVTLQSLGPAFAEEQLSAEGAAGGDASP